MKALKNALKRALSRVAGPVKFATKVISHVASTCVLAAAVIILAVYVSIPIKKELEEQRMRGRLYELTLLTVTSEGLASVGKFLVTNVRHRDGALCFRATGSGKDNCIKFDAYQLQEFKIE